MNSKRSKPMLSFRIKRSQDRVADNGGGGQDSKRMKTVSENIEKGSSQQKRISLDHKRTSVMPFTNFLDQYNPSSSQNITEDASSIKESIRLSKGLPGGGEELLPSQSKTSVTFTALEESKTVLYRFPELEEIEFDAEDRTQIIEENQDLRTLQTLYSAIDNVLK